MVPGCHELLCPSIPVMARFHAQYSASGRRWSTKNPSAASPASYRALERWSGSGRCSARGHRQIQIAIPSVRYAAARSMREVERFGTLDPNERDSLREDSASVNETVLRKGQSVPMSGVRDLADKGRTLRQTVEYTSSPARLRPVRLRCRSNTDRRRLRFGVRQDSYC